MNAVENTSVDLILRVIDESDHATLIPVKTSTCKLNKQDAEGNPIVCSVSRDEDGAILKVLAGQVFVNSAPVESVRLKHGDQICLGDSCYVIHQLGSFNSAQNEPFDPVRIDSRFSEIQTELDRQTRSFDQLNSRFDQVNEQISQLVNAIQDIRTSSSLEQLLPSAPETDSDARRDETRLDVDFVHDSEKDSTEIPESDSYDQIDSSEDFQPEVCAEVEVESPDQAESQSECSDNGSEFATKKPDDQIWTEPNNIETEAQSETASWDLHSAPSEASDRLNNLIDQLSENAESATEEFVDSQNNEPVQKAVANEDPGHGTSQDGNLEQLLASLNNISTNTESVEPEEHSTAELSPESTHVGEAIAEDAASEDPVSADPADSGQVDSENQAQKLEDLFASLRANDEDHSDDFKSARVPEDVVENAADFESNPDVLESTANNYEDDDQQILNSPNVSSIDPNSDVPHVAEFTSPLIEEAELLSEQPELESPQTSERKLLDQLRSIQREQAELVNEETREDAEIASDQSESETTMQPQQQSPLSTLGSASSPQVDTVESENDESISTSVQVATDDSVENESPQQESVAELLERMNREPTLDENVGSVDSGQDKSVGTVSTPVAEIPVEAAPRHNRDEENGSDVQDYMNSLLQRLNSSGASAGVSNVPVVEQTPESAAVQNETLPAVAPTETEEFVKPLNPDEFVPKQVAPEINSNLAAMRELANATSRSAVETSQLKRKKDTANLLLVGAGAAIVAAVCTTFLSKGTGDTFYWLSMAFFALTAICSGVYAKSMIFGKPNQAAEAKKSEAKFDLLKFLQPIMKKWSRSSEGDS